MSGRLRLVPVTRDVACAFVDEHHRHHPRPQGYRFAVGVLADEQLVGVAIAGRPVARLLDDGVEVTGVAVADGSRNASSLLYAAAWRAAKALGYRRLITYTQKALGFAISETSLDANRSSGVTC